MGTGKKALRYSNILKMVDEAHPKTILDIGVWNGIMSKKIIQRSKQYHPAEEIRYYGFDLWEGLTKQKEKQEMSKPAKPFAKVSSRLSKLLPPGGVTLVRGNTHETLSETDLPPMDYILIDGGHSVETVSSDWKNCQSLLHSNTIVLFDDYWHDVDDGPRVLIDSIDRDKFSVEILPPKDDIGFTHMSMVKVMIK